MVSEDTALAFAARNLLMEPWLVLMMCDEAEQRLEWMPEFCDMAHFHEE